MTSLNRPRSKSITHFVIQEIGQNILSGLSNLLWAETQLMFLSVCPSLKRLEWIKSAFACERSISTCSVGPEPVFLVAVLVLSKPNHPFISTVVKIFSLSFFQFNAIQQVCRYLSLMLILIQ